MKVKECSRRWNVIVVGGGFAGFAAALSTKRTNPELKVLLVEQYNCCGGAASFDLINPFMCYWTNENGKKKLLSAGIFEEIISKLDEENAINDNKTRFSNEYLKLVMNRMLVEAGVEILFNTTVTDAERTDGIIKSITVYNVSGKEILRADFFIDCTGDANLSAMAGFAYKLGRESDNLCQPMTLCFRLGDVHKDKFDRKAINELYKKYQADGKIRNPRENVLMFDTMSDSVIHFNTTRIVKLNPTDAWDVSKAEIEAREQIDEMVKFLRGNFEAFKDCVLLSSGIRIGARESRMIEGLHTLTADEIMAFTKFDDGIAACNYDIDIHSPDGSGTSHWYFPEGKYYTIPYRCLVPKKSKNVLAAGRCVSCDHAAQASLRIMPVCCTLGQAAGTAAALCICSGVGAAEVDISALREKLRKAGCVID